MWKGCVFSCWPLRVCWHNPPRVNTKCSCCRQGSIGPCPPKPICSLLYPLLPSPATPVHCNTKTAGFLAPKIRPGYQTAAYWPLCCFSHCLLYHFKWLSQCVWSHSRSLTWSVDMAPATSNLLMLIPVLCCCVCGVSLCRVWMWQWLRADEGGHPQHPPRAQAAALSLPKAERFSREDVLEQPNEINHWILALALQTWPRLSASVPVWKGQWCKCCGWGG